MSRYISFRAPDDLAGELEREGSNRSQAVCDLLREALAARLSRLPVQGVPDSPEVAPGPVSAPGRAITETAHHKNRQLATLAGPRCPKHPDWLWKNCRQLECVEGLLLALEK